LAFLITERFSLPEKPETYRHSAPCPSIFLIDGSLKLKTGPNFPKTDIFFLIAELRV
jgi:hypothetical protein